MIMDLVLVGLPLALFVTLAAAFVAVYRRAVDLAADSRASELVRRAANEHAASAARALAEAATRLDALRRDGGSTDAAQAALAAARPPIAAARDGVAALRPRPWQESLRTALLQEITGAAAPLAAADRACEALAATPADLDAQTGVKRAYLGLLHAREAVLDAASDLVVAQNPLSARRSAPPPRS